MLFGSRVCKDMLSLHLSVIKGTHGGTMVSQVINRDGLPSLVQSVVLHIGNVTFAGNCFLLSSKHNSEVTRRS